MSHISNLFQIRPNSWPNAEATLRVRKFQNIVEFVKKMDPAQIALAFREAKTKDHFLPSFGLYGSEFAVAYCAVWSAQ